MKIRTTIFGVVLIAMLSVLPHDVLATTTNQTKGESNIESTAQSKEDDPLYARAHGNISNEFYDEHNISTTPEKKIATYGSRQTANGYTQNTYTHATKNDGYAIVNGIDVSKYQKAIDWNQVKQAGIDFAFIRVAYRGASTGNLCTDPNYAANIQNATAAGVKVGVYIFSQALSPDEGRDEANYVLNLIRGYNVTMPVIIDYEYSSGGGGRLQNANLSRDTATATVNAFSAQVAASGYTPMVYANKSMLEGALNTANIPYLVWLAHYTTSTSYAGDYRAWQYSSKGSVPGIAGNVDMDFWYGDTSNILYAQGTSYNGIDYSSVFDADYYSNKYPDVKAAYGTDQAKLLQHFVDFGMKEGRQGNATFNVKLYKSNYSDLNANLGNDLSAYYTHYIKFGQHENRVADKMIDPAIYNGVNYSPVYNYEYYITKYPDVKNAFGSDQYATIQHFVEHGMQERRQGNDTFHVEAYIANYKDLRKAFGNHFADYYMHYVTTGKNENRVISGSTTFINPETVYNGVDYSAVYDYNYYITKYPDVANAFPFDDTAVLKHFVEHGMSELRQANDSFDVSVYKNNYPDLETNFGNDNAKYYLHYVQYGKNENRIAK